jgi:putative drug exporter of the RND superfamily
MPTWLYRLAGVVIKRRRWILVAVPILVALAGLYGGSAATKLVNGGYDSPTAESSIANDALSKQFQTGSPDVVFLVAARHGTVDDPQVAADARALEARLRADRDVADLQSYWSSGGSDQLRSRDGTKGLILIRIPGPEEQSGDTFTRVVPDLQFGTANINVTVDGPTSVGQELSRLTASDLRLAELIAFPLTALLLLFVFRSVVAASLPLVIAACAVPGTLAALNFLTSLTDVNIFALNLTTALGLGLAIDYSLLIVSRFREEMAAGFEPHEALRRTMATAGRTVLFSSFAVASSLAALLVFPLFYLRSFAYAGIAVVAISALGAVVILPALLAVVGRNIDRLAVRRRPVAPDGQGFWYRLATGVMRRPVLVSVAVVILLLVLITPFFGVQYGRPDFTVLPESSPPRVADAVIRAEFPSTGTNAMPVVAPRAGDPAGQASTIDSYAATLSQLPDVAAVQAYTGSFVRGVKTPPASPAATRPFANSAGTWLSVVPERDVDVQGASGKQLVTAVRDVPAPWQVYVGGASATLIDTQRTVGGLLPWAFGIIALITICTIFVLFGSVLIPLKAIVLTLLSLTATFGAMVWIFQDGHGAGLLGFTASGHIDLNTPILMFCLAFGLSMDYEVFLLSRIKELHDGGADTATSVATGLARTGRIITAAAGVMAVVFIAFSTAHVSFVKMLGVGMTLAVLMDATVIRGLLVPALMKLLGPANWWAPGPLRRLHDRIGISETVVLPPAVRDRVEDPAPEDPGHEPAVTRS